MLGTSPGSGLTSAIIGSVNFQANALLVEIAALIPRLSSCQLCNEDSHPAHMQGSLPG
jgi:hypothetical protein